MLPFPKRKATSEVELDEDDFVLVEDSGAQGAPDGQRSSSPRVAASPREADLAQTVQRAPPAQRAPRTMPPPGSRRVLDGDVEEDVAGQCLASIAAETSRDREPYSSSHIRLALGQPPASRVAVSMLPPPLPAPVAAAATQPAALSSHFAAASPSSTSRLPAVTAPPFLRTTTLPLRRAVPHAVDHAQAPGIRESSPRAAFVRRSSPVIPAATPSSYASLVASSIAAAESKAGSVAPVSFSERPNEPTVIVVRERPRAAWIVAAAAMGALGSIAVTRILAGPGDDRAPAALVATQAPLAAPPSTVVVPPAVVATATSTPAIATGGTAATQAAATPGPVAAASTLAPGAGAPTSSAAVVHFGDDQGVAIKAPAPQPRRPAPASASSGAAPASKPAQPARAPIGPALPDGSFGLGRADNAPPPAAPSLTQNAPGVPSAPIVASASPEAARRRALTPEQQLAEAQLKASMK